MLKVYIDGSIGPKNPGQIASYGFEVRRNEEVVTQDRGVVARSEDSIYTNNVAEYGALIAFFKWYWKAFDNEFLIMDTCIQINKEDQLWTEAALVHSDSQLLVNQMNGMWAASRGIYLPYYKEAMELYADRLHKFIGIKWIRREQNVYADELSKYNHYV